MVMPFSTLVTGFGSERPQYQHHHAPSHIGGDDVVGQRRQAHPLPHGVDAQRQIFFAVDQRPVEVEDHQLDVVDGWFGYRHRSLPL
jgi:hypothetical protein